MSVCVREMVMLCCGRYYCDGVDVEMKQKEEEEEFCAVLRENLCK